jgi:hypothetical protein
MAWLSPRPGGRAASECALAMAAPTLRLEDEP